MVIARQIVIKITVKTDLSALKKTDAAIKKVGQSATKMTEKVNKSRFAFMKLKNQTDRLKASADKLVNTFRRGFVVIMSFYAIGRAAGSFARARAMAARCC